MTVVGDDKNGAGGTQDNGQDTGSGMVKHETYVKAVDQVKSLKAKLAEFESKLAEVNTQKELEAEEKLRAEKKTEELLALKEKELAEVKAKYSGLQTSMVSSLKQQALERELGGVLNPTYLKFADMNLIQLDEEGNVDSESLKACADKFRNEHPMLLKKPDGSLPNGKPKDSTDTTKTPDQVSWKDAIQAKFGNK